MKIARRHWAAAFSAAALAHAGVAAALLWQPPESGAKSIGLHGLQVSLGPAGGAPGSDAQPVEEIAEVETEQPRQITSDVPPEQPAAVPPEPAPQEVVEPVQPQPVEEAAIIEAVEAKAVEAVERTAAPPTPETVMARAVIAPPPPKRKPRPPEARRPAPRPEPVREVAKPPRQQPPLPPAIAVAPSAPGAQGKAGAQASPDAGSANDTTGGGMPGEMADYMALLQAWLEKHKEYPRRAQLRRQEGTALLYFVMDREGQVLEYRLQQSSGHRLLDHEVVAMINRAKPLPKMPDDMRRSRLELVVPVQFFLK